MPHALTQHSGTQMISVTLLQVFRQRSESSGALSVGGGRAGGRSQPSSSPGLNSLINGTRGGWAEGGTEGVGGGAAASGATVVNSAFSSPVPHAYANPAASAAMVHKPMLRSRGGSTSKRVPKPNPIAARVLRFAWHNLLGEGVGLLGCCWLKVNIHTIQHHGESARGGGGRERARAVEGGRARFP
jgi:hypothetical protein